LDALAQALDAERLTVTVTDPLGRPVEASFGMREDLAIVETAAASGLQLVDPAERNAVGSSTAGTGQLIAAVVQAGARTIYLGVGGSATTDGGWGAVRAIRRAGGLRGARLTVLCDVSTPFEEAAEVFAAQKGATQREVKELSIRLHTLAASYPRDPRGLRMGGAAGGLAGGLWAALDAELVRGAPFVLNAIDFNNRLEAAQFVVTGEGKLDSQSLEGKLVSEVARQARAVGVPVYAIVGRHALETGETQSMGISQVIEASTLQEIETAAFAIGAGGHSHHQHASFG